MKIKDAKADKGYRWYWAVQEVMREIDNRANVNYSTTDVLSIKIQDWQQTSRRWKLTLDGDIGVVTYGKREVIRSDDLGEIAKAVFADEKRLMIAGQNKMLKRAEKDGDVVPFLIHDLRNKAIDHDLNVETWDGLNGVRIRNDVVVLTIEIEETIMEVTVSSPITQTQFSYQMADPSFDPETLPYKLFDRMVETEEIWEEAKKKQNAAWGMNSTDMR
jgi:hypothetical protein